MARGLIFLFGVLAVVASTAAAQSSDQLFPTPVRSSEIVSTIKARDIGDARVTTYFYTLEGEQGDVFLNVQSKNFTGDIDLFVVPGQVPLTKIVIYGDQPETETGRVVYLRKPERLLLRVQGRTPGDDEASVRIKFAGSFVASKLDDSRAPTLPTVESTTDTNVRVNSVGTILEVIPKERPTPDAVAEKSNTPRSDVPEAGKPEDKTGGIENVERSGAEEETEVAEQDKVGLKKNESSDDPPKLEVAVSDPVVEDGKSESARTYSRAARRRNRTAEVSERRVKSAGDSETRKEEVPKTAVRSKRPSTRRALPKAEEPKAKEETVEPMAGVRLVVYFKDGSTIERPMTEVQRFAVEKAVLTIVSRDGSVGRYQMIDIQRVSIE